MTRSIGVFLVALSASLSTFPAPAQTALDRLESRLRQQLGKAAVPAPPAPQAQQPGANAPAAKPQGQAWLGVVADDEKDRGRGVRVMEITPDGPAAKAGFLQQDLITSVGGIRVRQMSELADMLELYSPGDKVAFEVQRDAKPQKLEVTLGQRPVAAQAAPPAAAPKPEEPLLLGPGIGPAAPIAKPAPAPIDDRGRIEALERRLQELERRVVELERALQQAGKPGK